MATRQSFTIASGQSLSAAKAVPPGKQLVGIIMSPAWTAAGLTFQSSGTTGGTFQEVSDDAGTAVAVTVAAGVNVVLNQVAAAKKLVSHGAIKVRSGTSGVPVVQAADRVLTLIFA
jgi:hypothetical protein